MPKPENFENTIFYYGYLLESALIKSGISPEDIVDKKVTSNWVDITYKDVVSAGTGSMEDAVDIPLLCTITADMSENEIYIVTLDHKGEYPIQLGIEVPKLVKETYEEIIKTIGLE